jgi:hypothetical protein
MSEITSGPDYDIVVDRFKETMPNNKILSVEVIQNFYLWKSYKIGLDKFRLKNGGLNEKLLWHGTN